MNFVNPKNIGIIQVENKLIKELKQYPNTESFSEEALVDFINDMFYAKPQPQKPLIIISNMFNEKQLEIIKKSLFLNS